MSCCDIFISDQSSRELFNGSSQEVPWVSPTQVVPKKSGITVVQNEKGEEITTRLTSGWRVCIDYRKLNAVTRKDHFPLPFIDQVLERVSRHPFYCFLDGYSGYFQIEIDLADQEKTTFTCPFGTYAYRRMPFGLCNAPATFQRCMLTIFSDMVERIMEVFMDDITVYGGTFEECLVNLEAVLHRCIEKDLVLNWEKCHFMVRQGIVLGHIISEKGIEVDKAKVEIIVKLPSPTTVKESCAWPREDGKPYVIYYASKTLNEAQRNYTTTEKELLVVQDAKARLIRWILLLQEFDLQIKDKKGVENVVADHLSSEWNAQDRKHFFAKIHSYYWEEPFLFKCCADQIIRKCVPEDEQQGILSHCHENACGGHFASQKTAMKIWMPKAIINDGGAHFCNKPFEALLSKYGVKHKVATPYRPQTSGQVELANREIKNILMKWIGSSRWGCNYGDACFPNRLHIFPGKLKSRWIGPFVIHRVYSNGVVELLNSNGKDSFKVNGYRLKPFMEPFKPENEEINLLKLKSLSEKGFADVVYHSDSTHGSLA
ncbi:Retrovirus-related Pol polyprotein from transposon 297 [Vitis vinifera]|uniref:Retrovirus-related Pol polyprotein from transposon 297 n=1 Tax=Vitis vinifera TaxID=29760 RepID=A0A438H2R4_VITVI|nr:Retrovirus-related Pol polyprotein from transposon 297 [Vitis vinifera]